MSIPQFITYARNLCKFNKFILYDPKYQDIYCQQLVAENVLIKLDARENSYLARSSLDDVARLESSTYVCTKNRNGISNWENSEVMKRKLLPLFEASMENKTGYMVPFVLGDINDPYSLFGLMITDSLYAAINMGIMTKCGLDVFLKMRAIDRFVKCIHSVGKNPTENISYGLKWYSSIPKYICNFPEEDLILSYGSGYGGNSILSKKCVALRLASYYGYHEGWFAEHMMLISLTKDDKTIYIAGAFPSACGKTNMALLKSYQDDWEIKTLGDDITWFRVINGQLHGMNPETGFFGVAPNTSYKTNPVCMETIKKNTIFTNVGLTSNGDVTWDKKDSDNENNSNVIHWHPESTTPAHANSRFTVPITQCPQLDKEHDKKWVPISAIIFGGRRETPKMPLFRQALNFKHGVLFGATLSSERTAAAEGTIGELRYDPFAMGPFIGYAWKDYFAHWLNLEKRLDILPNFYYINLFGKKDGQFIWPGFKENIELLKLIHQDIYSLENIHTESNIHGNFYHTTDIDNDFWLEQYSLDKQFLIDNDSPEELIQILDEKIENLKNEK